MTVADRVETRIKSMGLTDTESAKVLRRISDARRERRAWWIGGTLVPVFVLWCLWRIVKLFRKRGAAEKPRRNERSQASSPESKPHGADQGLGQNGMQSGWGLLT